MATKVMSRPFVTHCHFPQARLGFTERIVVKVKSTANAKSRYTPGARGRGFRSRVKRSPTRVAPPISMAIGMLRPNPQVWPCGEKYATQSQPKIPIHGRNREAGTSGIRIRVRSMSRMLFDRHALGQVAGLVHIAAAKHRDVVRE